MSKLTKADIIKAAEGDLYTYAVLTNPTRVYGDEHRHVFHLLEDNEYHQLLLLPRSHMKSHCIAVWVTWWITKHPETTVVYVSATDKLVLQQMYAMKQILESDVYRRYWPEMVHPEEARREKWSATEIKVDHPKRKEYGVRDATIMSASIGANTTGLHCDVLIYDDIVVPDNAYTEGGRQDVQAAVSQFSSIANPGAIIKAVGTRYHPRDVYGKWDGMQVEQYDDSGNPTGMKKAWQVYQKPVHDDNGNFLWPRTYDTRTKKWYGFNHQILAGIRSSYFEMGERAQYYAQYFNDANNKEDNKRTEFIYYNREKLFEVDGVWNYLGKPLSVACGGDFAYTTGMRSDFTAFAVVGATQDGYKLILDLDQFRSDKYEDYFQALFRLQRKWGFRKAKMEVNGGANVIVNYIRDRVRQEGLMLGIEMKNAVASKGERVAAILQPEYDKQAVLHFKGGWISEYEEQLTLARPAHDDLRDAVTLAFDIVKPPAARDRSTSSNSTSAVILHPRFGGRRAR